MARNDGRAARRAPSHRILLDNDRVRVLEVVIEPGTREPEHTHQAPSVMIVDEPAPIRYHADGTLRFESHAAPGSLVTADFATGDGVLALLRELGDRPIDLLVNNAGFGTYGPFDQSDAAREMDVIGVDVAALVRLTRAVLPGMVERGRGGVLNIASTIAFQPAPYQATYGAAKAFVLSFSQALWQETRHRGVTVTALCPGPTKTGFVNALRNAEAAQTAVYARPAEPGPVVDAGLRALDRGAPVAVPGLRNQAIAFLPRITPRRLLMSISARVLTPKAAR
jgi:short-subunit dehydrogenase